MSDVNRIDARIARAFARVRLAFRAVMTALDTKPGVQLLQADGLRGEKLQASELFQHFGFTSAPPAGTQCIVLPLGGKTAHSVIVATEAGAYRVDGLKSGEVAVYNQSGAKIVLKEGKIIEIECDELKVKAEKSIRMEALEIEVHASEHLGMYAPAWDMGAEGEGDSEALWRGSVHFTGTSRADVDHVTETVSLRHHVHREHDGGGPTEPPDNI
ncbi:MAG: phage baseplate assembly protein [Desulfovibrio sp.]|nr:phage baseplate assembly protein [Desulfovibrio sp.]MBI4960419.1 phage baseplate assembly protein [Desulfovibrio sp.]